MHAGYKIPKNLKIWWYGDIKYFFHALLVP